MKQANVPDDLCPVATVVSLSIVASGAYVSDRAMFGFASMDAPAFRMLGDMYVAAHPEAARIRRSVEEIAASGLTPNRLQAEITETTLLDAGAASMLCLGASAD
mgnify:CR=1 FL=1